MERNKILISDYLDILFDGRNKKYGSYDLRNKYASRSKRATLLVLMSATLISAAPLIASAIGGREAVPAPVSVVIDTTPLDLPRPEATPPPPPPPVAPQPEVATIANPVLKVVEDEQATTPPPAIEDLADKRIALQTNDGGPATADILPGPGTGGAEREIGESDAPKPAIYTTVEQMPNFNGDLGAHLLAALRYPEPAREAGDEGTVGVQFVVNEDGSISNVTVLRSVTPQLDAEAVRVVSSMPRWTPGKQNGKAVKVYFKLPIRFTLN